MFNITNHQGNANQNHMRYYYTPVAAAAVAKSLQLCPTLCDPTDGSPPGSSVPGILQARILEWVAISFSKARMRAKTLQSCPTLCDPMDSSPLGSSVHRILQARILEWFAISFSNDSLYNSLNSEITLHRDIFQLPSVETACSIGTKLLYWKKTESLFLFFPVDFRFRILTSIRKNNLVSHQGIRKVGHRKVESQETAQTFQPHEILSNIPKYDMGTGQKKRLTLLTSSETSKIKALHKISRRMMQQNLSLPDFFGINYTNHFTHSLQVLDLQQVKSTF